MEKLLPILIVVIIVIASTMDYQDEVKQQLHYCEMVKLYKSSNGENGWPDYKNIYETECKS